MVERGKVWRNIVLPVLIGGAAVLTPLTFRSKTPLEDGKPSVVQVNQLRAEKLSEKDIYSYIHLCVEDTLYLPQDLISKAFGNTPGPKNAEEFESWYLVKGTNKIVSLGIEDRDVEHSLCNKFRERYKINRMGSLMLNSSKYGLFELIIADVDNYGLMGQAYGPTEKDYTPQVAILPRGGVDVISQLDRLVRSTKPDTVYLPQAVIDSAFGWKYGKVVDLNAYILNELGDGLGYPKLIKLSDRWAIATDADIIVVTELDGSSPIGKEKFGMTLSWEGKAMEEFRKKLKSKEMRFILYTDKDGHNCLVVKRDDKTLDICYAGIPGHGLIWITDDNSPSTIGNIGFLPVDFDDGTKGLMVMAQIKGDGIVGIDIVREPKPYYSVEYRVEVASR